MTSQRDIERRLDAVERRGDGRAPLDDYVQTHLIRIVSDEVNG